MDARIKPGHDGCISWARSRRASHPHRPQNFQTTKTIQTQLRNPATLRARGVHLSLAPKEGVGNAGCPLHPRPRVHFVLVESTRVTTSTPESPGIPARNGFNGVCRALPGDRALLPPSPHGYRFVTARLGQTKLRET